LIFEKGTYRTNGMNPALVLILQKNCGLQKEKAGNTINFENVSGDVPFTDLTSNQFIDGMKKIFELQPFINCNLDGEGASNEAKQWYYATS
jgi:hypothetical protein